MANACTNTIKFDILSISLSQRLADFERRHYFYIVYINIFDIFGHISLLDGFIFLCTALLYRYLIYLFTGHWLVNTMAAKMHRQLLLILLLM